MTRHHISCLVNSMVADGLGTWRARVAIGMVLSVNREYPGVDTRRVKPFQAELILGNKNIYILYHFSTVQWCRLFNSLAPGRFEWNFKHIIFRLILMIHGWVTVTTNRSYHQPTWRRPKTASPNNRGYHQLAAIPTGTITSWYREVGNLQLPLQ